MIVQIRTSDGAGGFLPPVEFRDCTEVKVNEGRAELVWSRQDYPLSGKWFIPILSWSFDGQSLLLVREP